MSTETITDNQKRQFLKDGFIVIKHAVETSISQKARDLITASLPKDERKLLVPAALAGSDEVLSLFNQSRLNTIVQSLMGPFPPIVSCQVAVTPGYDKLGGAPGTHVDGGWSGVIPDDANEIDWVSCRPKDAVRYFGENDDLRGTNDGQLWMDPDRTLSYGSYTALVGVCLNDQREPGNGQLGVLKGMHEDVEKFFQMQRDSGGIIGPEGVDWPRIRKSKNGRPYVNGLPNPIRAKAEENAKKVTPTESWPWPELTPVLMEQGDAVIAMHSLPHTPTPNLGPNPRMNVYFRIRRLREASPHEGTRRVAHGVSDHPDRGYFGQFLEYPDSYNPWKTSVEKLCDHWSEWDGMQSIISSTQ